MTTLVRVLVAQRLYDVITTALAADDAVVIDHIPSGAPSDQWPREFVGIGDIEGTVELVGFRSDVVTYADDFTIDVVFGASKPGKTQMENRVRCGELVQAVIDAIRADPGLTVPSGIDGFASLQLGDLKGPSTFPLGERTGSGSDAVLQVIGRTHKHGAT